MFKFNNNLSLGIGVACFSTMLFLSSCSKEEAQIPPPESAGTNQSAGLRSGVLNVTPSIPVTDGPTCQECFAPGWGRKNFGTPVPNDAQKRPAGTSNLKFLWGNTSYPWIKPLPATATPGSIITVTSYKHHNPFELRSSQVITKIKHLKPGKDYSVTFQVATTAIKLYGYNTGYSKAVYVYLPSGPSMKVDLVGFEAKWITKTMVFTAIGTEADLVFGAGVPDNEDYTFANIFVGKNAVKQLN